MYALLYFTVTITHAQTGHIREQGSILHIQVIFASEEALKCICNAHFKGKLFGKKESYTKQKKGRTIAELYINSLRFDGLN